MAELVDALASGASGRNGGVYWKKLELTFSKILIPDYLLPVASAFGRAEFSKRKIFLSFEKKRRGREILKKTGEKFSVLSSDEIGGGSKKRNNF